MWTQFPSDKAGHVQVLVTACLQTVTKYFNPFKEEIKCTCVYRSRGNIYSVNDVFMKLRFSETSCVFFLSLVLPAPLCVLQQRSEPPGGSWRLQSTGQSYGLSGQLCCKTQTGTETQGLQQEETCQGKTAVHKQILCFQ